PDLTRSCERKHNPPTLDHLASYSYGVSTNCVSYPQAVFRDQKIRQPLIRASGFLKRYLLEWEAKLAKQLATFLIVGSGGNNGDVHTTSAVTLVHVDFFAHGLLRQTRGVVTVAVELLVRPTAEVTDTWQRDGQQTVEEFPHAVAAQGNASTNWHAFTQLEVCNGLLCATQLWLLTGNEGQIFQSAVDDLGITGSVADAHVDNNLDDARDLHDVVVGELLVKSILDFLAVASL